MGNTLYHFKVQNDALFKALSIFSEFFYQPLLKKEAIEKEIKAVHSEFLKNQNNDTWKSYRLFQILSNPESPLNKFCSGNADSLNSPNIHEHVKEFFEKFYR